MGEAKRKRENPLSPEHEEHIRNSRLGSARNGYANAPEGCVSESTRMWAERYADDVSALLAEVDRLRRPSPQVDAQGERVRALEEAARKLEAHSEETRQLFGSEATAREATVLIEAVAIIRSLTSQPSPSPERTGEGERRHVLAMLWAMHDRESDLGPNERIGDGSTATLRVCIHRIKRGDHIPSQQPGGGEGER